MSNVKAALVAEAVLLLSIDLQQCTAVRVACYIHTIDIDDTIYTKTLSSTVSGLGLLLIARALPVVHPVILLLSP